jgi:hypothetical protein
LPEEPPTEKPGGSPSDAGAITPDDPHGGPPVDEGGHGHGHDGEHGRPGGKEGGGSPADAVGGDRNQGQTDPLSGRGGDWPHGGGPQGGDGPRGNGWGNQGNGWGNQGNGWGNQGRGGDGLISGTLNQTGQLVSGLGTLIFGGRNQPAMDTPRPSQDSSFDAGGRNGAPAPSGGDPGRVVDTSLRAPGESTPRPTQPGTPGRSDSVPIARSNGEPTATSTPNGAPQTGASGRPAEARGAPLAGNAATPQPTPLQQSAAQAGVLTAGLTTAAQQALLGGLAANQTNALPQQAAQPQSAPLQQQGALLQDAQARQAAGLPLTPEQRALLQGALLPNPGQNAQPSDKALPQQLPGDELRNPQQLPADAKRQAEAMDRSMARQTAEQQQTRTANDPRTNDAQVRADARALRDGAEAKTRANLADARPNVGENAKQNALTGAERRPAGTAESLRHALDWVGQQVRGAGADARTDEEGVTAMRVVAGLVVAAVVVGVSIAVLYALRVAFVP